MEDNIKKHTTLLQEEAKFFLASIVESSQDSIVTVDFNNVITSWNKGAENLYGYPAAETIGKPLTMLTLPEDLKQILSNIDRIKHSKKIERFETIRVNKQRQLINLEIELSPVKNDAGKIIGVSTFARNITERKRTEVNLAFLAEISQYLVQLTNISETMIMLAEKIGKHFNVSRCAFFEFNEKAHRVVCKYDWYEANAISLTGYYRLEDFYANEFIQILQAGKTIVVNDCNADKRIDPEKLSIFDISSYLVMPIIGNKMQFVLSLCDSEPQDWREDEIELIRELTIRIWTRLECARTEELLRRSEEKYRALFASMDEGYCIIEMYFDKHKKPFNWKYIDVNPAFEKNNGLVNAAGKTILELVPDIEPKWFDIYGKVALTGEHIRFVEHSTALKRWFSLCAFPVGEKTGNMIAVIFTDITRIKNTELRLQRNAIRLDAQKDQLFELNKSLENIVLQRTAELSDSNSFVTAITQTIPQLITIHDVATSTLIYYNHNRDWSRSFTENGVEEFQNTHQFEHAVHPGDLEKAMLFLRNRILLTDEEMLETNLRIKAGDGKWGWICIASKVFKRNQDGSPTQVISVTSNISKQKEAELQIKEQLHFITQIAVTMPDMLSVFELGTMNIEYTNKEPFALNGFNADEIAAMSTEERRNIIHPAHQVNIQNYFAYFKTCSDQDIQELEYQAKTKDGSWKWFKARGKVFRRDLQGKATHCVNIVQNIDVRKKTEKELIETNLRQQNEVLNAIIVTQEQERERIGEALHNGVAQLLYAIQSRIQIINAAAETDEAHKKVALSIVKQAIKDTRTVSFELVPLVLREYGLFEAIKALCEKIIVKPLHITVKSEGTEKGLKESITYAVFRIAQELINNIIKHSMATEGQLTLKWTVKQVQLRVNDNGKGFDVKSSKIKGIGLQSIKNRVKLLNGKLTITSDKTGTKISVLIPL